MPDHDPAYVHQLADQLLQQRPDLAALLNNAENELVLRRAQFAIVGTWINNPRWDHTAREALARELGLPAPTRPSPETTHG
ncbi:hypothetical protein [Streptomyces sp. NPDC008150]|uniref:hypothetical protein n=1 Tax=Streptomyces sp. NPDC008150 TaxID=3364816 RepID=UPI0036F00FA0